MRAVRTVLLAAATIMVAAAAPASAQQSYPNRPVQLVVPVPPGGAADFIARTVSAKLADALGQPVVINNQGGAGGTIASRGVAKAEPDGYTLLLNSITTHGIGPHLYATLPYDPVTDFVPVILLAKLPLIMTVTASLPAKTVQDVVELAKAQPGQLAFASSGNGGAPHLAGELFKTITGTDLLHVPYRGSGPAVVDVVAGRIAIMFDAAPSLLPFVTAGFGRWRPRAQIATGSCPTCRRSPSSGTAEWTSRSGTGLPHPRVRRRRSCSGSMANWSRYSTCRTSDEVSPSRAPRPPAARLSSSSASCTRSRPAGAWW